ncbi:MAG TPA: BMP family ABC transporter substrate-binding protein [Feifaniaceae bacterium]|nr:BMP family ABC transporter substrate-binding protein [Feifaniaceae bacterium]
MKHLTRSLIAGILLALMLAGCAAPAENSPAASAAPDQSAAPEAPAAPEEPPAGEKKLVYLFIKNRGDLSYWDSMAEGGDRAAADFAQKADIRVIETTADLQANLTAMYEAADAGTNMIVTASDYKDNLVQIAKEYPEIAMVLISENVVKEAPNIYGIDFQSSQGAFLAGIVAADVASQGVEGSSKSKTIGFIGGMDESVVIQEFFLGYIQGAKYYDPETKIVYNYVGGWNDPDTARTQALAQYNDAKADIIFACAGGSGNGVHTAAAQANKYVIGVDKDQTLMYEEDKAIQSRFVTSVLKLNNNAVYNVIQKFVDGEPVPFGVYDILGLESNAVGLVENDLFNQYVSDKGRAALEQAKKDIVDGKVQIVGAIGKEQTEIKALIEQYLNQ